MDNLPVEILEYIFRPLHQLDKVECILVCHSWKRALESTILLKTIRLQNEEQLNKLVIKMHLEPQNRDKVERLIIEINNMEISGIDLLPLLFSSIREVTFYEKVNTQNSRFTKTLLLHPWKKTIKIVREVSGHFFAHYILKGGVCANLTEIQMNGEGKSLMEEFIDLLRNAPNLKILTLSNSIIAIMNLEVLHDNTPLLNYLSLNTIRIDPDVLPTNIEPANLMDTLILNDISVSAYKTWIDLYKYFALKYKDITRMMMHLRCTHDSWSSYEDMINNVFAIHMQEIGSVLTTLEISGADYFQYLFPLLDQNRCQLKKFSNSGPIDESDFNYILASNQTKFIKALSLSSFGDDTSLNYLSKLTVLTELNLCYDNGSVDEVDINDLLEATGNTLETLKLSHVSILIDRSFVPKYPRLNKLILEKSDIPEQGDFFLSEAFPHLRTFIIDDCTWDLRMFYLDNMNLSRLELRDALTPDDKYVLISTLCNGEKRWYTANQVSILNKHPSNDPFACPAMKSLPFDQFNGLLYTTFICKSLDTFFLVNTSTE